MSDLRFDGKVAIITGAGNGLGRAHALLFASRGAKVVVNDLGGAATGGGKSSAAADKVVEEIKTAGGEAVANYDSVEDGAKIVQCALDTWKSIDIVVNNAGILRDTSFQKMSPEDWDLIYRVHVLGGYRVTAAAWNHMRDKGYGRIIFTASAAGIYGNFGQANYSMAKLGLLGLSNTLAIEGKKKNVNVNTIAPIAGSRLTETVLPKEVVDALKPETVSPLVALLCHESCTETGGLYEVGGGFFSKLRWERTEGVTFRTGRVITPDTLNKQWSKVTSFAKSTHPTDIMSSMQPILTNVQSPPSKGGNEFIDVDQALGFEMDAGKTSYDERDLSLYALSVGAASNPAHANELEYVYEMHPNGFKALPTYAVVPAVNMVLQLAKDGKSAPGLNYGLDRILHGEQYTEVLRPLPPHATLTHKAKIKDIFDKGKMAVVVTEVSSFDEDGELLMRNEVSTAIRGAGGWGGDRGTSVEVKVPERAADVTVTDVVPTNQALFYRLSGDWNPLHVDPDFAKAFGFEKPILHGLCTFGYVGRNVITAFAPKGDSRYFKSIRVRFAESVFPGETLVTEMWKESETRIVFRCKVKERDKVVISNAYVELYQEIPQKKAKPAAAASSGATPKAESGGPTTADVFAAIADYIERTPDIVSKVGVIFLFNIKNPDRSYTVDLKNGKGEVVQGVKGTPECTLEIAESDFIDMTNGKADAQKLYFGGKLKISGNIMASQKLEFLKKMDPAQAKAAADKARAAGGGAAAPAPMAARSAVAPKIFEGVKALLAKNPGLKKEIDAVLQFVVTGPDASVAVDFVKGEVRSGGLDPARKATFTISDEDLEILVSGKETTQSLYQKGKLRVDGDVHFAQKLNFLRG